MLNKKICKQCWRELGYDWDNDCSLDGSVKFNDHPNNKEAWEIGTIFCYVPEGNGHDASFAGNPFNQALRFCPYALEHIMDAQKC